jgi:hypothetical protein
VWKSKIPATGQLSDTLMTGNGAELCRTGHPKPGSRLDLGVDVIVPQVREPEKPPSPEVNPPARPV